MWLPYLNFGVAISALGFQTSVLYPWHHELDHEFKVLKEEHKKTLQRYHQVNSLRLEALEERMNVSENAQKVGSLLNQLRGRADGVA